jgi:hypothetical protein
LPRLTWHAAAMRLGIGVVLSLLVLLTATTAQGADARYWSLQKVMRKIDEMQIRLNRRVVRVESDSALCSGEGASIRRGGVRMWRRFACTFTTFTKRGIDRDLEFRLRVTSATRFVVLDVRWALPVYPGAAT